jgi:hypothetical protein
MINQNVKKLKVLSLGGERVTKEMKVREYG